MEHFKAESIGQKKSASAHITSGIVELGFGVGRNQYKFSIHIPSQQPLTQLVLNVLRSVWELGYASFGGSRWCETQFSDIMRRLEGTSATRLAILHIYVPHTYTIQYDTGPLA